MGPLDGRIGVAKEFQLLSDSVSSLKVWCFKSYKTCPFWERPFAFFWGNASNDQPEG